MGHKATVTRVIDGDTFVCEVNLDFELTMKITVRLLGVDTWEVHGPQKSLGLAAMEYLKAMIESKDIQVEPVKKDSFGRWLCFAYFNGESLSEVMQTYQKKAIKAARQSPTS
jgi:endonuclease YncB( thermonuclease family)